MKEYELISLKVENVLFIHIEKFDLSCKNFCNSSRTFKRVSYAEDMIQLFETVLHANHKSLKKQTSGVFVIHTFFIGFIN